MALYSKRFRNMFIVWKMATACRSTSGMAVYSTICLLRMMEKPEQAIIYARWTLSAAYRFQGPEVFTLTYNVKGPKKDYVSETHFVKLAAV